MFQDCGQLVGVDRCKEGKASVNSSLCDGCGLGRNKSHKVPWALVCQTPAQAKSALLASWDCQSLILDFGKCTVCKCCAWRLPSNIWRGYGYVLANNDRHQGKADRARATPTYRGPDPWLIVRLRSCTPPEPPGGATLQVALGGALHSVKSPMAHGPASTTVRWIRRSRRRGAG